MDLRSQTFMQKAIILQKKNDRRYLPNPDNTVESDPRGEIKKISEKNLKAVIAFSHLTK